MKLKLDFAIKPLEIKLLHGEKCVLIGSCFSNEMGTHFLENGFDVLLNPFGTVFHPEPISRLLSETISGNVEERIIEQKGLYFSWDAGGTVFGYTEAALRQSLQLRRKELLDYLSSSKYLFITFGSTFGYVEKESGEIVANCHKVEQNNFRKTLIDKDLLVESWRNTLHDIRQLNPSVQVVFTVSPVRHVKDGLIENNRSKARLLELISELEHIDFVHYFPAYEIVIDELRDYRFYKSDGIHPDEQATRYVWERLKSVLLSRETQLLCDEIISLRAMENHESLYAESAESIQFRKQAAEKIKFFLENHPEIKWHKKP